MFSIGIVLLIWGVVWLLLTDKLRLQFGNHFWYDFVGVVSLFLGPILMIVSLAIKLWSVLP